MLKLKGCQAVFLLIHILWLDAINTQNIFKIEAVPGIVSVNRHTLVRTIYCSSKVFLTKNKRDGTANKGVKGGSQGSKISQQFSRCQCHPNYAFRLGKALEANLR